MSRWSSGTWTVEMVGRLRRSQTSAPVPPATPAVTRHGVEQSRLPGLLSLFACQAGEVLLVLLDVLLGVLAELRPATVAAEVVGLALVGHLRQRRPVTHDAQRPDLVAGGDQRGALLGRPDAVQ